MLGTAELMMSASGICWIGAYILIIRRSRLEGTYGMPIVACAANLAWEVHFSFIRPFPSPQLYINYIYLALDLVIFFQVLAHVKDEFPGRSLFLLRSMVIACPIIALVIIYTSHASHIVPVSKAYAQNFMMSALFIAMLIQRNSPRGQSFYIAILKCAGTVLISAMLFFVYRVNREMSVMTCLYALTFALDVLYASLVFAIIRKTGENPLSRL